MADEEGGLGGLLGDYGSDEESPHQSSERQQQSPAAPGPQPQDESHPAVQPYDEASPEPMESPEPSPARGQPEAVARPGPARPAEHPEASPSIFSGSERGGGFDALPPELAAPPGACDPEIQARVARWLELQSQGRKLTETLRASRDYRNPEFFKKMVEYWEIDEHGTSFDPGTFDPASLPEEDTIEALKAAWAAEEERRRAARSAGTAKIEFTRGGGGGRAGGGVQATATVAALAAAQAKAAALAAGHRR